MCSLPNLPDNLPSSLPNLPEKIPDKEVSSAFGDDKGFLIKLAGTSFAGMKVSIFS